MKRKVIFNKWSNKKIGVIIAFLISYFDVNLKKLFHEMEAKQQHEIKLKITMNRYFSQNELDCVLMDTLIQYFYKFFSLNGNETRKYFFFQTTRNASVKECRIPYRCWPFPNFVVVTDSAPENYQLFPDQSRFSLVRSYNV